METIKIANRSDKRLLKISQKDWYKIGISGRWLKIAEPINIDGKMYDEINGELVEVPDPSNNSSEIQTEKKITIDIYKPSITFIEGELYQDGAGQYKVLAIDGDNLTVLYIDGRFSGQTKQYSSLSRAKIIHNEQVRQNQLNKMTDVGFTGSGDFLELGYLAKNGTVIAQIPTSQQKWFEEMYTRLTNGDNATNYKGGLYTISKDETKFGLQLRIKFPEPDDMYLSKMEFKNLNVNRTASGLEINDTNYVKSLLKMGFKLGNNEINIPAILNNVPKDKLSDFNLGTTI